MSDNNYDYGMSPEDIDKTYRDGGRSAESEARIDEIVDAYVRAVRRAIYNEVDLCFDDPADISQLADLAWGDGWRHGTEFARAMLTGRRSVLNPSRPISLRRLGELVEGAYGRHCGAKNPTRLREDRIDTGEIATRPDGRPDAKRPKLVLDLDDVYKVWPALRDHPDLQP